MKPSNSNVFSQAARLAVGLCLMQALLICPAWAARTCEDGTTAGPGNKCPEDPVEQPEHLAAMVSQSVPTTMVVGQSYNVSLTFKNNGSDTWTTAASYALGSTNPNDNTTWGRSRVPLSGSVAQDQSTTFNFTAIAPKTAGTHNFQWRMVQDGVTWFGSSSTNVAVQVQESVIKGNIDGISGNAIKGWACSTRLNQSITIHLYAGGSAGVGTAVGAFSANLASEAAVATSCQASGTAYRFSIPITDAMVVQHGGKGIYIHGISPVGASNLTISKSGTYTFPVNKVPTVSLTSRRPPALSSGRL